MFERITKAVGNIVNRNPVRKDPGIAEVVSWMMTGANANKQSSWGWGTYYSAMDQEYVSACISAIVSEVLACNFEIDNPIEGKDVNSQIEAYLNDLFQFPEGHDSLETYTSFMWRLWSSFLGTGDVFIENAQNEANNKIPGGFYYIPPHKMKYYSDTAQYGYVSSDIRFETDELIHIMRPDFLGNTWGKSPIDSIARSITLDIYAWNFNRDFFKSGMHPRGVFTYDATKVTQETFEDDIARLAAEAQNAQKKRSNLFLHGGQYQDVGSSNKDMEFLELTKLVRDRIIGVYGVPPQKVGVYESSTLGADQDSGADKNFWKKRNGEIKLFEDAFNNTIGRDSGWAEIFKIKDVDLENKLLRAQTEDLKIRNNTVKVNEVRDGYGMEPVDYGDIPFSLLVAKQPVNNPAMAAVNSYMRQKGIAYG